MKYGVSHPNLGDYADPRNVARLARTAEESGWDGLFVWDHLGFVWDGRSGDPWVLLTAAAMATERIRLGTAVTPLPRRRPHVVAFTLATLDVLTNGRMVLGAGLGPITPDGRREFTAFGEDDDLRVRAEKTDEALEVLDRLWSGEEVSFAGRHFTVDRITLRPAPVQRPRIPVWIGGGSGAAFRRAAKWDGWIGGGEREPPEIAMRVTPDELASWVARIGRQPPFEIAFGGYSASAADVEGYADAGATWWVESIHGFRGSFEDMLERVKAGPPR